MGVALWICTDASYVARIDCLLVGSFVNPMHGFANEYGTHLFVEVSQSSGHGSDFSEVDPSTLWKQWVIEDVRAMGSRIQRATISLLWTDEVTSGTLPSFTRTSVGVPSNTIRVEALE